MRETGEPTFVVSDYCWRARLRTRGSVRSRGSRVVSTHGLNTQRMSAVQKVWSSHVCATILLQHGLHKQYLFDWNLIQHCNQPVCLLDCPTKNSTQPIFISKPLGTWRELHSMLSRTRNLSPPSCAFFHGDLHQQMIWNQQKSEQQFLTLARLAQSRRCKLQTWSHSNRPTRTTGV
jgi:hypothetical protein